MLATCGKCHEDTLRRQRASRVRHPPIADGRCTLCHDAHASDRPLLFTAEPAVGICRGCHPGAFHGHQLAARAHPRNPNVSMDCMSCHRAHGTENDHLLPVPNKGQLCARCHMSMGG
jgi:predicted CXXCH cytochrome family protein